MILDKTYILNHLRPSIKKAWICCMILLILFIVSILVFLMYHELFSYILSVFIMSLVSLFFLIPMYIVAMNSIYYPNQLSKFIKTFSSDNLDYQKVDVLSSKKEVTINHLVFKPITCRIGEEEKILFFPSELFHINLSNNNLELIISNRFVIGVKDA